MNSNEPLEFHSDGRLSGEFQDLDQSIFALASPYGKSAVAVFRCSGQRVFEQVSRIFSRSEALQEAESHQVIYGYLLEASTRTENQQLEKIDEVLLLKFIAPRSYTGENMLEIHCHGSIAVVNAISGLLQLIGLKQAAAGEFTYRSIKYGKRSLAQSEALSLLANSYTETQRRDAIAQMNSNFIHELSGHREKLLEVLARFELQLDYDQDELDFDYSVSNCLADVQACQEFVANSLAAYRLRGPFLKTWKLVLVGAVNSGKSSLFNYLLHSERSIVSQEAGTTRDFLEAHLELAGHMLSLYDTAGLRSDSDDPIEQEGIQRSWQKIREAEIVILVHDANLLKNNIAEGYGQELLDQDNELYRKLKMQCDQSGAYFLELWNKVDCEPSLREQIPEGRGLAVSAHSGYGLASLLGEIEALLPHLSSTAELSPSSERQARLLLAASELLRELVSQITRDSEEVLLDLTTELLRQICSRLGEVNGQVLNREALRHIWDNFCVGK